MNLFPQEVDLAGIFLPPLLVSGTFGLLAAWYTAYALNRFRLSRFFWNPPLVLVALAVIYTGLFSTFLVPG